MKPIFNSILILIAAFVIRVLLTFFMLFCWNFIVSRLSSWDSFFNPKLGHLLIFMLGVPLIFAVFGGYIFLVKKFNSNKIALALCGLIFLGVSIMDSITNFNDGEYTFMTLIIISTIITILGTLIVLTNNSTDISSNN